MTEPRDPEGTRDREPPGDPLDAGLAVAFGPDPAAPTGPHQRASPELVGPPEGPLPGVPSSAAAQADQARFPPGIILAGRYRIVARLGRGGMGEVYRADDLKLGQSVALKLLPPELVNNPDRLHRFHAEVRIARQVSHPHVCRVYDIGEADGQPFLTMEYIDGEDLASLLRRIGRLPDDKGLELARQLCAGLAAAHDKSVLHRDLKPQNIMIDGRGQVRITDFGLAGFAEEFQGEEIRMGTPAYQAPEQLAGKEVTVKSDLYALGLVLYEMVAGKRAFPAKSREEPARLVEAQTPARPSSHVTGLDPAVERVILWCLEKDPRKRPNSALAVLAALPGGDPLAAALAAGQTPSPETVANATEEGSLHPLVGAAMLAAILLGILSIALLTDRVKLFRQVPLDKGPEVLADRARGVIERLGYTAPPKDSAYGFDQDDDYLRYVREHDPSAARWDGLATGQPAALYFWYRQGPYLLVPTNPNIWRVAGKVSPSDPPHVPGMVTIFLDPKGRLIEFYQIPERVPQTEASEQEPDWSALFTGAGLDPARFTPTSPQWNPPVYCDKKMAWEGVYPDRPDLPVRVEAAAYRGKPVYFQLVGPWSSPGRLEPGGDGRTVTPDLRSGISRAPPGGRGLFEVVFLTLMTGAALLAYRNLRRGRADRKGAFRLALYVFSVYLLAWILAAHHSPEAEVRLFCLALGIAVWRAGGVWLFYIALEPYVRRRWPWRIISWNRLLAVRFRDPLVGRDILIGGLLGVCLVLLDQVQTLATKWLGLPPSAPSGEFSWATLSGVHQVASKLLSAQESSVGSALGGFMMAFLFLLVLRRNWLVLGALVVLVVIMRSVWVAENPYVHALFDGLMMALVLLVLMRFGLVALAVGFYFADLLNETPITAHLSAWYAGSGVLVMLVLAGLAVYGFSISLAGRPLLRDLFFQDE